jgi:hypothetical protein
MKITRQKIILFLNFLIRSFSYQIETGVKKN